MNPVTGTPDMSDPRDGTMTDNQKRRRRARSIAIAVILAVLVVLFYLVTITKLGLNIMDRPL